MYFWEVRGGDNIICAQKPRNLGATNTVPIIVVPRRVSQKPVFLAGSMRWWSIDLRSFTMPFDKKQEPEHSRSYIKTHVGRGRGTRETEGSTMR